MKRINIFQQQKFENSILFIIGLCTAFVIISSCEDDKPEEELPQNPVIDRLTKLPGDIAKQTPETDDYPPVLHSAEYEDPVPLSSGINTSGAEDSPYILPDGSTMYFFFTPDVRIPADKQIIDSVTGIWLTTRTGETWSDPVNITNVNSSETDGWPFVSSDGNELWFTRWHLGSPAIFKSVKNAGEWGNPELIISQFAGECTLDDAGNAYFVHHYYKNSVMIEADIYVCYKK